MRGILPYGVGLAATFGAVALRWLLDPVLQSSLPLVTLFGAVAVAVWYGGWKPAAVATVAGYAACAVLFIEPRGSLGLERSENLIGLLAYAATCSIIIGFGEALRLSEAQARESRESLRVTLASIGDGVLTTDKRGRVTFLNAVAESLTGWKRDEAIGQPLDAVFRIVNEESRAPVENPIRKVLALGTIVGLANHTVLIDRNGTERPIDDSAAPIRDQAGALTGAVLVFRDVTASRAAERILRHSEARKTAMLDTALDCIVTCDHTGRIIEFNPAAERTFGYRREDVIDRAMSEVIVPPSLRERHEAGMARHLRTGEARILGKRVEMTALRANGEEFPVELSVTRVATASEPVFTAFLRDITPRKAMERDLRRIAAELSEVDRRKTEFLAMLAHELRNPLAPLRNGLQILSITGGGDARIEATTDMMDRQVGHMVRLVDDLLDVSRISRGKIELKRTRTDVATIVEQAVEAVRPQVQSMGHRLTVRMPKEPIELEGDPTRLTQVVGNLLTNAVKFSERGKGEIQLIVDAEHDTAVIRVQDNGIGIPAKELPRIFEMFTQLDQSLERSQGGLGIGLTLVKTLVEMHGGAVEVHSDGLGRGTEFVVRLPIIGSHAAIPLRPEPAIGTAPPIPRRVLVVDDNRDSAHSLAMLLELAGHDVRTAHDGLEAVDAAAAFQPNLILLDIGMPRLNGYEAARRIREQQRESPVFLIALTGWGQEADQKRSHEAGFDAHLVKPADLDTLVSLMRKLPTMRPDATVARDGLIERSIRPDEFL